MRDEVVLILSDPSEWYITLFQGSNPVNGTSWRGGFYTAAVSDLFNNPPPEGSTITLEAGGDCEVVGPDSFTVGTQGPPGAYAIELQTGGVGTVGNLDITVNPEGGTPYTKSFNCVPAPPPTDPNDPSDDDGLVVGP